MNIVPLYRPAPRPRFYPAPPSPSRWRQPQTAASAWDRAEVPLRTGPLEALAGRRVLVIADVQNITASAANLGASFSYRALAQTLGAASRSATFHAFCAGEDPSDTRREDYFSTRGWTPYRYQVHYVDTCRGTERRSNVDTLLACVTGALVSRSQADVVAVCSGDGQLVQDIAQAITLFPKPRRLVTISLAGSTAHSLDARRNALVEANIECGRDVLHARREG